MQHANSPNQTDLLLQAYFKEYEYLKQEQLHSINMRHVLIFVLLTSYCGLFAYALSDPQRYFTFLLLPWLCFILGWQYFSLHKKIVGIRFYLRDTLSPQITTLIAMPADAPFAQEKIFLHRNARWARKLYEIAISLFLFCIPSIIALGMYLLLAKEPPLLVTNTMIICDIVFAGLLALWVVTDSDLSRATIPHQKH